MADTDAPRGDRATSLLLERDGELSALAGAIERATGGDGSVVAVEAHAGLGKTRLLGETCALARSEGHQVLRAAGNELEREFAFGVTLQLFEAALPPPGPARERVFEGAAGLTRSLLEKGALVSGTAADEGPILHGLYWLTSNLAEPRPVTLVVDDLHWADRPSLRFLLYLAQRMEGLTVAVAVGFRPREPGAPGELSALRAAIGHEPLRPAPLGPAAVDRVVRARFPQAAPEFVRSCRELTGGNPFLLEELIRGVAARGHEPSADVGARLGQIAPDRVLDSVVARVARLPAGASELGRAVAILGPNAHLRSAAALSSLEADVARRAADALADSEVLRAGDPLGFVHPLLRAVIYDDIPPAERAAAHGRAARLLARDGAAAETVAAHLLLAERAGDAWTVDALRAAATAAMGDGVPASAVTYLRRSLAEPPPPDRRGMVLLELGRAEAAAGEHGAVERLRSAVELMAGPAERARAALDLARALHSESRYLEAAATLDAALERLDGTDERLARELEATWVSVARLALPLRGQAVERLTAIMEHPRADSYPERLLLAHASGQKTFAGDPREEGCALARLALADGELMTEGGPDDQGWLIALATFAWADDFETAERGIEACREDARRRGLARRFATAAYGLSMTHYYAGRLMDALADTEQALEARHLGWLEYLPAACGQTAWALIERDALDAAERVLSVPELAQADNASQVLVIEARARLHAARGDQRSALADALEAGRLAVSAFVWNPSCLPWRSTAAIAAAQLGETEQARDLAVEDLRLARRYGAPRPIGVALRAAGLVEGGDAGVELLREAVTTLADSPAGLEHARALVDLGATLRRSGHPADAREPLREGLAMVDAFGGLALARRAREELSAAGARPRRRELSGVDSLTPSELRVARLAAGGMTNREIAQALFVTAKAVQFHLGNSYRKLGIAGRGELVGALTSPENPGLGA